MFLKINQIKKVICNTQPKPYSELRMRFSFGLLFEVAKKNLAYENDYYFFSLTFFDDNFCPIQQSTGCIWGCKLSTYSQRKCYSRRFNRTVLCRRKALVRSRI